LRFLTGVVFAHTCDAMQALADLWRMGAPGSPFVYTVMQPVNLGTPAARPYLLAELFRFQEHLTDFDKSRGTVSPPGDEQLRDSIALYDETRHLVAELRSQRGAVSTSEFFAILDAAQIMPRETFNPLLSQVLSSLEAPRLSPSGPRLFLSGAVLDERRLLELIEDLGASVAGDDLCTGSRHFHGRVAPAGPQHRYAPLEALADYYLERPPCPTKYHPVHDPGRHLLNQVDSARADGVVFTLEKFCEPHAFDYARVLPSLDAAGVPHLLLEMEQTPSLEAWRTRLQAFLETL
jgi:benzoyl-CoA reductase/2-hydroxyglutaryl-CoA dehydratase subunit BcrC/BadD/HgdB